MESLYRLIDPLGAQKDARERKEEGSVRSDIACRQRLRQPEIV